MMKYDLNMMGRILHPKSTGRSTNKLKPERELEGGPLATQGFIYLFPV
jgi:hypothetical protein